MLSCVFGMPSIVLVKQIFLSAHMSLGVAKLSIELGSLADLQNILSNQALQIRLRE